MRNNEPNAPNQETRHSSCPYPVSSGQMPVPSATQNDRPTSTSQRDDTTRLNNETVPVGMLSPYFKDHIVPQENFPLTGLADEGTELINFRHHSNSALNEEDITLMEQIPVALPIGFKTVDVQMDSSPSAPPPSYNELFIPTDVDGPTAVIAETAPIRPQRHRNADSLEIEPITDTRTTPVPRNRTTSNRTEIPIEVRGVRESPRNSRTIIVSRPHHVRANPYQNISDDRAVIPNEYQECFTLVFKLLMAFFVLMAFYWVLKVVIVRS